MSNETIMRHAPIRELLLKMSLPVTLVMLVTVLYNMADVFFLGRAGDPIQVAAVSLAGPVFAVFSALNTLIGFGGCTGVSLALGRGERLKARQYSAFVLYAGLLLGAATGAAVLLGMKPLLTLLGADTQTAGPMETYLRVMAIGAPFAVAGGALGNTIRADGDVKSAFLATMSGTIANIVLDPLFISLLGWGVTGAGIATVLGNLLSFTLLLRASRMKECFSLSLKDFTWKADVSVRVFSLGLPMASGTLLMSFSSAFYNRLLVAYGNEAVAVQGVAGKAGMLIAMIAMGICMGVQPAISNSYGRGDRTRVRQITLGIGAASMLVCAALAALCFLNRDAFIMAFLPDSSMLTLGRRMILGGLVTAPLSGAYQMESVYLQSTGKVGYATFTALLQKGIVFVPVLYFMNRCFALDGLIFAGAVTDGIATAAALVLCLAWARQQAKEAEPPHSTPLAA